YNDGNGNTSTQTQNVIVDDVTAPVADAASLADVTMECEVLASDVTKTTATDNCGGIVTVTNDATFPITTQGTTVITWTYTDVNGNSSTQTQNINVLASPISVVTFNDKTVTYNGNLHSIMVNNLPTDASVTYSISPSGTTTNGATDAGIYTVTAVVTPPATAVNCDPITLTATLTIEQAPQTITFNPLAIMVLEDDPDFQLQAIASSGLAVDYTYTYTSANPPATVSSTGWVDLLTSGLVDITAHQAGNANYLPATSVMQTLQINSRDASAHSIEIEDEVYSSPSNEIYYLIACEDAFNAVTVTFETETNASVNPSHNFTIETPIPGIYREEIIITSQDGSTTETYLITVEKMFSFSDIVEQKFDNVLLVNNNPSTNGGYSFVAYEWYKDDQIISVDQYYSAGPSTLDLLDPSAEYYVRMETTEGDILQTCIGSITLEHDFSASIFPNPNESGSVLNIELEGLEISSAELLNINLYSLQGAKVGHWVSDRNFTTVKLPETLATGVYIVNCTADNKTYNFKLIIE
ncbi:Por secretion system C-terminal sorting domain-containing protein, partial [Mesonia phycicola]